MLVNLSFGQSVSTGSFYTRIHDTMAGKGQHAALPPTATEFADWLTRQFVEDVGTRAALDCGCGTHAFNIRACCRLGFGRAHAIDVNPAVAAALRHFDEPVAFTPGSLLCIPFSRNEFDLVICAGVAHHTPNPPLAFR